MGELTRNMPKNRAGTLKENQVSIAVSLDSTPTHEPIFHFMQSSTFSAKG